MVLDSWNTGDTITAVNANHRGLRRGTTSDRDALIAGVLTVGDMFFNTTEAQLEFLKETGPNFWSAVGRVLLGSDSTVVTVTGVTATQVKDLDYVRNTAGQDTRRLTIIARLKTDTAGQQADCRIRLDSSGSDSLVLSTTSASFIILTGVIDVSGLTSDYHTIQFFLDDTGGHTATLDMLEVWGD